MEAAAKIAPRSTRNRRQLRHSTTVNLIRCHVTKIHIPTPLRPFTGKRDVVEVEGATVGELLRELTSEHEALKKHLYNDDGKLRSFVNVYLNDEDIRYLREGAARRSSRATR